MKTIRAASTLSDRQLQLLRGAASSEQELTMQELLGLAGFHTSDLQPEEVAEIAQAVRHLAAEGLIGTNEKHARDERFFHKNLVIVDFTSEAEPNHMPSNDLRAWAVEPTEAEAGATPASPAPKAVALSELSLIELSIVHAAAGSPDGATLKQLWGFGDKLHESIEMVNDLVCRELLERRGTGDGARYFANELVITPSQLIQPDDAGNEVASVPSVDDSPPPGLKREVYGDKIVPDRGGQRRALGDVALHLFWECCAREGLTGSVGSQWWKSRMHGSSISSDEWIEEHKSEFSELSDKHVQSMLGIHNGMRPK